MVHLEKEKIKSELLQKLHDKHAFWSYDKSSCQTISDWNLIKFVLIHLDIDDIDLLFKIYPKQKIKHVWQKSKQLLCVLNAVMIRPNGWENALSAVNGIRMWRK
jgi:hypothetical protein